jgi:hypothetical protein
VKVKKENDSIKIRGRHRGKVTIKQEGPRQMSRRRSIRQVRLKKIIR